jgi:hypothetical protein
MMEEEDMPWTQAARDRKAQEDELRQELKQARQELQCATDGNRPEAWHRYVKALKALERFHLG